MQSEIRITNHSGAAVIDIEGVIGVPERMQFEQPGERVATYSKFTETLRSIEAIEADRIEVNIRSSGGDVNDALLIYDALTGSGATVTTRCYGYVASAATIIAQAASPGRREISANTLYLIHCSESAAEGNTHSLSQAKDLLDKTDQRIAAIYAGRSGRSEAEFAELMNENNGRGRWLPAHEAVAAGLADKVMPAPKVTNTAADICDAEFGALMDMLGLPQPPDGGGAKSKVPRVLLRAIIRLRRLLRGNNQLAVNSERLAVGSERLAVEQEVAGGQTVVAGQTVIAGQEVKPHKNAGRVPVSDRTVTFEQQTGQSSARPTTTKAIEDPSPTEIVRTANEQAYDSDIQNLRFR